MGKKKNAERKKKVSLVFDENKRKDFLCGFRKRKLERKKKAQEDIQRLLKEERKRIKQENKESYKKLVVSSRPLPDIEQLLKDEYEDEDVNVKIVELSSDTLQKKDLVIGENKAKITESKSTDKPSKNLKAKEVRDIPGMGSKEEMEENEASDEEESKDTPKTKKELKKLLQKQATKKMQKSKVFQMKSKLDRVQNKKKSHQIQKHGQVVSKGRGNPRNEKKGQRNEKKGPRNSKKEKSKKSISRRKH